MKTILTKIAAVLAFIIGAMAIVSGGQVLMGKDPGYYVINWLPVYNYSIGILSVFVTAALIWTNHKFAMPAAIGSFSVHAMVMLVLRAAYPEVVASESIRAMTIRLIVWGIILGLMNTRSLKNKAKATPGITSASPGS